MFSTFSTNPHPTDSSNSQKNAAPRPKRSQVARACDWCRLNRIKCDDNLPCQNCRQRGGECKTSSKPSAANKAGSREQHKEIQRLRDRVKHLETKLKEDKEDMRGGENGVRSMNAMDVDGGRPGTGSGNQNRTREGSAGQTASHDDPLGLSNLPMRLHRYINKTQNPIHMQMHLSSRPGLDSALPFLVSQINRSTSPTPQEYNFHSSPNNQTSPSRVSNQSISSPRRSISLPPDGIDFSRTQEEHYLDCLWQSFHPIYPILSETDFRSYYDGLWARASFMGSRQPSALVDSLLAVASQYSSNFLGSDEEEPGSTPVSRSNDTSRIDYAFYLRSQALLMEEMESPSLTTIQSYIYCIIYLHNGAMFSTAHHILGLAIRLAQTLRLHLGPGSNSPSEQQDSNARLWWTLYELDSTISMALGRPPLIQAEEVTRAMPSDELRGNGAILWSAAHPDISWISFYIQHVQLISVVRDVHLAFWAKSNEMLQKSGSQDLYQDYKTIESMATWLEREIRVVTEWTQKVPKSLKNQRRGTSEPLSTDRSPIKIETTAPLWLQRQRIILELIYHDQSLTLLTPFLRFTTKAAHISPLSDQYMITCISHATTSTNLLFQILSETDLLRGWLPIIQYQWNAIVCMLAFVITNPICPYAPGARKGIQTAIRCLEIMGSYSSAARGAAQIARTMNDYIEDQSLQYRSGSASKTPSVTSQKARSPPQAVHNLPPSTAMMMAPSPAHATPTTFDYQQGLISPGTFDQLQPININLEDMPHSLADDFLTPQFATPNDAWFGGMPQWSNHPTAVDPWVMSETDAG